jgi:hypothetical protein
MFLCSQFLRFENTFVFYRPWRKDEFDFSAMAALANEYHAECGENEFLKVFALLPLSVKREAIS